MYPRWTSVRISFTWILSPTSASSISQEDWSYGVLQPSRNLIGPYVNPTMHLQSWCSPLHTEPPRTSQNSRHKFTKVFNRRRPRHPSFPSTLAKPPVLLVFMVRRRDSNSKVFIFLSPPSPSVRLV